MEIIEYQNQAELIMQTLEAFENDIMHFKCWRGMADFLMKKYKDPLSIRTFYESSKRMIITHREKYQEIKHQKDADDFEHHFNNCEKLKKEFRPVIKNNRHYNDVKEAFKALEKLESLKTTEDIDEIYTFIELLCSELQCCYEEGKQIFRLIY